MQQKDTGTNGGGARNIQSPKQAIHLNVTINNRIGGPRKIQSREQAIIHRIEQLELKLKPNLSSSSSQQGTPTRSSALKSTMMAHIKRALHTGGVGTFSIFPLPLDPRRSISIFPCPSNGFYSCFLDRVLPLLHSNRLVKRYWLLHRQRQHFYFYRCLDESIKLTHFHFVMCFARWYMSSVGRLGLGHYMNQILLLAIDARNAKAQQWRSGMYNQKWATHHFFSTLVYG